MAKSSGVEKPAGAVARRSAWMQRSLSGRDFEDWLDTADPPDSGPGELETTPGTAPDATTAARHQLNISAAGRTRGTHAEALHRLADAVPVFVASSMHREAQTARCEAAGHLIDLGCAHEARRLLVAQAGSQGGRDPKLSLAEQAKLSVALMDLGLGNDSLDIVTKLAPTLQSADSLQHSRLLRRCLILCADVLLAAELARGRRIDTALAQGMPPRSAVTAATQLPAHACTPLLGVVLQALQRALPDDLDVASLLLLHGSVSGEDGVADRLLGLTQRLSGSDARLPAAWLRLCVAYRLAGRMVLAAHCATEAITAAIATGSLRLQQRALQESALIQINTGQTTALADTWRGLREVDLAIWGARAGFEGLHPLFGVDVMYGVRTPVPSTGTSSARALHVETAIAKLKAEPGRPWKVDALAEAAGVSRRTLEQAFRLHGGMSVSEVIREHRVQRAQQLLRLTDHAIKRVAIEAGYSSASTLCRELREQTGLSPRQIRLQHRRSG